VAAELNPCWSGSGLVGDSAAPLAFPLCGGEVSRGFEWAKETGFSLLTGPLDRADHQDVLPPDYSTEPKKDPTKTQDKKEKTTHKGLSLAQFLGGNKIIIQSDNVQVIETLMNGCFSAMSFSAIFDDCRMLSVGYRKIQFEHCNREANQVAHELARYSFINHVDEFWDNDPPSFIIPAMVHDVTII
jgi:hypothetical protein